MKYWFILLALMAFPASPEDVGGPEYKAAARAYHECILKYSTERLSWNVTAGDLADAAASQCQDESFQILKALLNADTTIESAFRMKERNAMDDRAALIHFIIETRQSNKGISHDG